MVIKIMTKLQKQVFPSNLNENILRFRISVKNKIMIHNGSEAC